MPSEGLRLSGWACGALPSRWLRGADGEWIGIVTFVIERTDAQRTRPLTSSSQLAPSGVLMPDDVEC